MTDRNDNPFLPESKKPDDILAPYRRGGGHVTPRKEAGLAELRAHEDYHRHMLALRIEREIGALAILSVAELETIVERTGLEIMQDAQDTMAEAESTLNPEYLAKFKKFTEYAHGQGMRDILEIQALGAENVREIAANITTYRHLPPEKKPLIDRILGIFRHA